MTTNLPAPWTIGVCAVGMGDNTAPTRTFADRSATCAVLAHPGATYNPWQDRTWCLCGQQTHRGDTTAHVSCCGGPLDADLPPEQDGLW